jgi:hypothetical protein
MSPAWLNLEAQLFRHLGREIERLVLRRRDPQDPGDALGCLDESP